MRCPQCQDEYEPGVGTCADCDLPLVPAGQPLPPWVDAHLGTFHPAVAGEIAAILRRRRIAFDELTDAEAGVEVVVDREWRDDLRAELVLSWNELLGQLPPQERAEVAAAGGHQPGWYDAPRGAWIDRQGRLQVDPSEREQLAEDQGRRLGPTLVTAGAVLLLLGWYGWGSTRSLALLAGGLLVVAGLLLPH